MSKLRRVGAAVALLLTVVVLAACGEVKNTDASEQPAGAKLRLNLATKNFTESIIMGELYKQALRAERLPSRHPQERRWHGGPRREAPVRRDRRLPRVHRSRRVRGRRRERHGQVGRGDEQAGPRLLCHARRGGQRGDAVREHRHGHGDGRLRAGQQAAHDRGPAEAADLHLGCPAGVRGPGAGLRRVAVGVPADQRQVRAHRRRRPVRGPRRGGRRRRERLLDRPAARQRRLPGPGGHPSGSSATSTSPSW